MRHHRPTRHGSTAVLLVALMALVSLVTGCGQAHDSSTQDTPSPSSTRALVPDPSASFTIVAGGDVLPHLPVLSSAKGSSGFDFTPLLAAMDPWISGADLALCNMEVPVAPAGSAPSGYPVFGTVPEVVRDLAAQGWDGCSTASNHAVDRGQAGIDATVAAFDDNGMGHVGTARSADEDTPQLYQLERAGRTFTIAHLAMTYSTNGNPVPHPWSVHLIDADTVIAQARVAREAGADMVLVSMHAGAEYQTAPTPQQVSVATALAESGMVDLVIGHHVHVPQPIEMLPGGPHGAGMWIAYGLGNYVSNQDSACCVPATSGSQLLVVQVTATGADQAAERPAGPPVVTSVQYVPLTVDRVSGHRVHALTEIPDGTKHLSAAEVATRLDRVTTAAGPQAPIAATPPTPTGAPA
ncbi:MAG: CapA family protein, partial [Micrococcales bacterium]|nr:CapA family protein [Micrococcales bacterium]